MNNIYLPTSLTSISLNPLPCAFLNWGHQWCEAFLAFERKTTIIRGTEDEILQTFLALQSLYAELDLKNLWKIDFSRISIQDVSTVQYLFDELFFFSLNKIATNDSVKKIYLESFVQNGSTLPNSFESCKDFVYISFLDKKPQNIIVATDLWNLFISIIEKEIISLEISSKKNKNKELEKTL